MIQLLLLFLSTGEKGRFSVSLVTGGVAEKAGVCKGDRLVWMNGAAVSDLTHSALTRMVHSQPVFITISIAILPNPIFWSFLYQTFRKVKSPYSHVD